MKFIKKRHLFIEAVKYERTNERAMYTYLDSVRTYYERARTYNLKKVVENPYAAGLRNSVWQALLKRMQENPARRDIEQKYQSTLRKVFVDDKKYLSAPIFFLFLPYYLFFELAKCEGLIKTPEKVNAFSCVTLGKDKPRWSIRSAPFVEGDVDPNQVSSLYQLVETALCEELQRQGYDSVGRELWLTHYEFQADTLDSVRYSEEQKQQEIIEDAIDFSVPFWQFRTWGNLFANAFFQCDSPETERNLQDDLEFDIHKLLGLEFRGSNQADNGKEVILEKYEKYTVCLRKQEFRLSLLLKALCDVYSLHYFGDTDDANLCAEVELLTGFLIVYDRMPLISIDAAAENQRLSIIWEGHPYSAFEPKSTDSFSTLERLLCCPSRILFNATFMRWNKFSLEKPMRYILTDTIPYSRSMEKFSDTLYRALCSEKALLQDISVWGGVRVLLDDDYICSLTEAFHVWSIWHSNEAEEYRKLEQELRKDANIINKIAEGPEVLPSTTVELDLSDYEFEQQLSDELIESKGWILKQLGALGRSFGKPETLNDFRYVMILFVVFRTLRDRMCQQAYDIYLKITDNHLGPPLMFRRDAFAGLD